MDANNGNTWLRATNPVTVYWPYPEGTDESTEFCLAHFAGLNREIALDDLDAAVAAAPIEEIEVENTPYGIRFTTNGFLRARMGRRGEHRPSRHRGPDDDGLDRPLAGGALHKRASRHPQGTRRSPRGARGYAHAYARASSSENSPS